MSRIVSRTECAWACDIRRRLRTSCRRSFAFFCNPRSWLYISGVSCRSAGIRFFSEVSSYTHNHRHDRDRGFLPQMWCRSFDLLAIQGMVFWVLMPHSETCLFQYFTEMCCPVLYGNQGNFLLPNNSQSTQIKLRYLDDGVKTSLSSAQTRTNTLHHTLKNLWSPESQWHY